jgi:hypothetical protein
MKHIKVFENFVPEKLNEISSETIKSAADIAMSQGQPGRVAELLKTHFYNYMEKPFHDGVLKDIKVKSYGGGSSIDAVNVLFSNPGLDRDEYFSYDVRSDLWRLGGHEIGKREAKLLSGIATILNPETKYKIATQNLPIKGYGAVSPGESMFW